MERGRGTPCGMPLSHAISRLFIVGDKRRNRPTMKKKQKRASGFLVFTLQISVRYTT